MLIGFPQLPIKLVFVDLFWKWWNSTVGEPFMAPGGEMFRYFQRFGENALRHGSHEWLPYSKNVVRVKPSNNNLPTEQRRYTQN